MGREPPRPTVYHSRMDDDERLAAKLHRDNVRAFSRMDLLLAKEWARLHQMPQEPESWLKVYSGKSEIDKSTKGICALGAPFPFLKKLLGLGIRS